MLQKKGVRPQEGPRQAEQPFQGGQRPRQRPFSRSVCPGLPSRHQPVGQDRAVSRCLLAQGCFNLISSLSRGTGRSPLVCLAGGHPDAHLSQGNPKLAKIRNLPLPTHPGIWLCSPGYMPRPWEKPSSPPPGLFRMEPACRGAGKRVLTCPQGHGASVRALLELGFFWAFTASAQRASHHRRAMEKGTGSKRAPGGKSPCMAAQASTAEVHTADSMSELDQDGPEGLHRSVELDQDHGRSSTSSLQ